MNAALLFLTGVLTGIIVGYIIARMTRRRTDKSTDDSKSISLLESQLASGESLMRRLEDDLDTYRQSSEQYKSQVEVMKERIRSGEEQKKFLEDAQNHLRAQFEALSAQMLKNSREELLNTNKMTVADPFNEQVKILRDKVEELQRTSLQRLDVLQSTTRDLIQKSSDVQGAAQQLTTALRSPNTKGRWGEVNLVRILEFVGLVPYCDFQEQVHVTDLEGSSRPDCIIRIPGDRRVIIDSKAPLDSYLDAMQAPDDNSKKRAIQDHTKKVRAHIDALSRKDYTSRLRGDGQIIEAVILFIPIEGALAIALESDPSLIEYGFNKNIILAFPTSLLAILKGLSLTIQQQEVANNIYAIRDMAIELHKRFIKFTEYYTKVGMRLRQLNDSYNMSVGSFNSKLLKQAEKFAELGGFEAKQAELDGIESSVRFPHGNNDQTD
ncbi:DNA recombination protein RmuC [Synechococcus sp. CBW1004]|uniref:DNA recombination protein RmuC n=1 Tax=Synechococcus sp. CBW1004 TaxID=1353136 RepID=UPI0018CD18BE|nr:DNA recombination protein RmuC [Synechococcus sp. CBW1004]QPN64486.1 DNA recombination protein RmuC [Synechococcus sp. CBW1004]